MTALTIGANTKITLHFALKLENGEVVDSTFDKQPATFVLGDGNLPEGFESFLIGLQAGAKEEFTVSPEQGFNDYQSANLHTLPVSDFAVDMPLAPGLTVIFEDAMKNEVPGVVKEIENGFVTIDFNHPLSGKNLLFQVEILDVQPA